MGVSSEQLGAFGSNSAPNIAKFTESDLNDFLALDVDSFLQMSPFECILCDSVLLNEAEMHDHMSLHSFENL